MKKGLVIEGGAMRGLFSAGVMDALYVGGVRFDGIIGVSAGACFGCNYKSHQPGRVIRYNRRFAKDPRYCSWRSLVTSGDLFNAKFCYHDLPERLDPFDRRMFEVDPAEFYCVTTECGSGRPVYRKCEKADAETFEWIRASASMPIAAKPVPLDGGLHLDGGLSDGIPVRHFESLGYGKNVIITTRPRSYRKKASWKHALAGLFVKDHPAIAAAIRERHVGYNATLDYIATREREGAALVLAPEAPLPISRICHDPDRMQQVYDHGLCYGRRRLAEVMEFLG